MAHLYPITWSESAELDFIEIIDFVRRHFSEHIADKTGNFILARVSQLAEMPLSGKRDPWLEGYGEGYMYVLKKYSRIVYFFDGERILILRVFDMRKNPSLFRI